MWLREPWPELLELSERVAQAVVDLPSPEIAEGFTVTSRTSDEMREAAELLRRAARMLEASVRRETPRFEKHNDRLMAAGL